MVKLLGKLPRLSSYADANDTIQESIEPAEHKATAKRASGGHNSNPNRFACLKCRGEMLDMPFPS